MPLYDFTCHNCRSRFETLVRGGTAPRCPKCGSEELERVVSLPAIKSDATQDVVRRDTQRRDSAQARERVNEQRNYERNHD
jgi:putative FmdB family regulatory protein